MASRLNGLTAPFCATIHAGHYRGRRICGMTTGQGADTGLGPVHIGDGAADPVPSLPRKRPAPPRQFEDLLVREPTATTPSVLD